MLSERALEPAATRAGLGVSEYLNRNPGPAVLLPRSGLASPAEAFALDRRRESGRAASCKNSVRRARQAKGSAVADRRHLKAAEPGQHAVCCGIRGAPVRKDGQLWVHANGIAWGHIHAAQLAASGGQS